MVMIDCPDCGNSVSDSAPACIHCGRPMQGASAPQPSQSGKRPSNNAMLAEAKVANEKKSVGLPYVLWFFLGTLGIHNFYLGRILLGVVQLACFVLGPLGLILGFLGIAFSSAGTEASNPAGLAIGSLAFVSGIIAGVVLGVTLLVDLFTIPSAVNNHTERLRRRYALAR